MPKRKSKRAVKPDIGVVAFDVERIREQLSQLRLDFDLFIFAEPVALRRGKLLDLLLENQKIRALAEDDRDLAEVLHFAHNEMHRRP